MQDHEFGQGVSFAEWSRGVVAEREQWEREHPEEAAAERARVGDDPFAWEKQNG